MTIPTHFQPVLERFTLRGVHGYKDITINFSGSATIIVAENGTGKTTVLSALNAFLTRRFHRLAALSFDSLECKFYGIDTALELSRSALGPVPDLMPEELQRIATATSVSEDELLDFIQNEYSPERFERLRHTRIPSQIYINMPGDINETRLTLDRLHAQYAASLSDYSKHVASVLRENLKGIDIVYLPTFRRIERPLPRTSKKREPTYSSQ